MSYRLIVLSSEPDARIVEFGENTRVLTGFL